MNLIQRQWARAERYIAEGQLPAARAALETLLREAPGQVQARLLLSSVLLGQGRLREACAQLLAAAEALPGDAETICTVAHCLLRVGETVAARACLEHPEIARTRSGPTLARLAHVRQALGEHEASLALMDRAAAHGFDNPDFRYFRSLQLQFNGRVREAEEELEACLRLGPTFGRASLTLARMRKQTAEHNHLDYIAAQLQRVEPGSEDHAAFEFARFKELDDLGRHDEAWLALARGNALMYARQQHDPEHERALFDGIAARCTPAFLRATAARMEGPTPIFIVGLPRTGTTLLERILGNHSQVASAGELPDFPRQLRWATDCHGGSLIDFGVIERARDADYAELGRRYLAQTQWRAQGRRFYVDKLPPNYMLAGFIHRALPQAPILHMTRAPMDVCFSNWKALFGDAYAYSYDLDALAAHYGHYRRLMRHWHDAMPGALLDVSYAELVQDPEAVARKVLEFCGLPYEDGCVEVTRNRGPVATLSSAQVREPIHTRSLGEWRRYERRLAPLRKGLGNWAA
ncbi:TPR repeat-containing protein [Mizugakiibacter sediminis]|uniref:TPR repeat-containing protein n=1 Tax=Mizugakiibacter sediminis TaxID=1475481 RepID=A0A0K8QM17_9GAMM|nr:sulfotransferase [Mizugakiibacter sediminis]GAP65746.1 TPR repeat-containing protein [Mizugakiibacter sediminis]